VVPLLVLRPSLRAACSSSTKLYLPESNKRQERLRNLIKGKPAQTFLRPDRKMDLRQTLPIYYYEFFDADRNTFGNISAFEFDPKTFEITRRVYAARSSLGRRPAHWSSSKVGAAVSRALRSGLPHLRRIYLQ